jgi:hypothetical protein
VRFLAGGDVIDADPGEGVHIDPAVPHAAHNMRAGAPSRVLLIFDRSTEGERSKGRPGFRAS